MTTYEQLRRHCSLSVERTAAMIGVTEKTWRRWEKGTARPHPNNCQVIAVVFAPQLAKMKRPPKWYHPEAAGVFARPQARQAVGA